MDTMILKRIDCGGIRQSEEELRYQLKRDGHPLAEDPGLIVKLAELERDGFLVTHMQFTLTERGIQAARSIPTQQGASACPAR